MNQEAILPLRAAVCGGAQIHAALVDVFTSDDQPPEHHMLTKRLSKLSDLFSSDLFFLFYKTF